MMPSRRLRIDAAETKLTEIMLVNKDSQSREPDYRRRSICQASSL
jgi:hypothetical protein